jgi:hypothetical protein
MYSSFSKCVMCVKLTPIVNKYLPLVPFAPLLIQPAFDPGFVFPVLALVLHMLALFAGADFYLHLSKIIAIISRIPIAANTPYQQIQTIAHITLNTVSISNFIHPRQNLFHPHVGRG